MTSLRDKVQAGQDWSPPSASFVNDTVDLIIGGQRNNAPEIRNHDSPQFLTISIANRDSTGIGPNTVVGFGLPVANPDDDERSAQSLAAVEYAAPEVGRWAIARDGIPKYAEEDCVLTGVVWAEVEVIDVNHKYVEWSAGNSRLETGAGGYARVLWNGNITGTRIILLQLGGGGGGDVCGVLQAYEDVDGTEDTAKAVVITTTNGTDECKLAEFHDCESGV